MNSVQLIGRLTADPELKKTQSELPYTRFCVAVDRPYSGKDGTKTTDFINITAWRKTAEFICKYFAKGKKIALNGQIQTGSYTDKDGQKHYTFDVLAERVEFVENKSNDSTNESQNTNQNAFEEIPTDDDLPF